MNSLNHKTNSFLWFYENNRISLERMKKEISFIFIFVVVAAAVAAITDVIFFFFDLIQTDKLYI